MTDHLTVSVYGITARGHHGVFPGERARGQRFVVDLDMVIGDTASVESDQLDDTVDYAQMAAIVVRLIEGDPVDLIERLASMIADAVLADDRVSEVLVRVRKPEAELPIVAGEASVTLKENPLRYWLGLGANLGDTVLALRGALQELGAGDILIERVSSAYRTAPRDDTDQPDFMNAAAQVRCDLPPPVLLQHVKAIEARLGRTKTRRFGPRTIDIDILLWSGGEWDDPQLRVPHPRLHERRFALVPLAEIAPDLAMPDGTRLQELLSHLDDDPDQSVEVVSDVLLWPVPPTS